MRNKYILSIISHSNFIYDTKVILYSYCGQNLQGKNLQEAYDLSIPRIWFAF